jgi:sec-independent protein translocase protein TatB
VFNLSGTEIVVILLLALVVLGPEKLPEALRRAGRTYAELKKMGNSFQSEMRSVLDEPMKEMRETADMLRKAVDVTVTTATTDTRASTPSAEPAPTGLTDEPDIDEPGTDAGADPAPVVAPNTTPMEAAPADLAPEDELINRTLSGES